MSAGARRRRHMLLILGALIVLIGAALIARARVRSGVQPVELGWVSERWLAAHRSANRT